MLRLLAVEASHFRELLWTTRNCCGEVVYIIAKAQEMLYLSGSGF